MTGTIKTLPHYFPEVFAQRIIISIMLLAALCVLFVLLFIHKKINVTQLVASLAFSAYAVFVLYYTVLGRYSQEEYTFQIYIYKSYKYLIDDFGPHSLRQVILNIVMLIPFGFLMPIVIKAKRKYLITLLSAFALILFIESLQLIMQCGTFEVDDIFNNLLGTVIGVLIYALVHSVYIRARSKNNMVD